MKRMNVDWVLTSIIVGGALLMVACFWVVIRASDDCAESHCPPGSRPRMVYNTGCLCVVVPEPSKGGSQ